MAKLVKFFFVFGPVKGTVKVLKKYANPGETIDESLMSTLCLPSIEFSEEPCEPRFQTFLVTKEDGQVLYGSGLIVSDHHLESSQGVNRKKYADYCYTIITDTPFIHATKSLLQLIWEKKCDDIIVRSIMNIPMPAKRKCLRIVSPMITTNTIHSNTSLVNSHTSSTATNNNTNTSPSEQLTLRAKQNIDNMSKKKRDPTRIEKNDLACSTKHEAVNSIDDIYLYRGMTPDLPLLDYPLRELFGFLHLDDFILAYICILMEFRTLIISRDNYKLMMVGEVLTSLLLPLKWCNVYVPILPPIYGATYLDAPTSYIMGINTQVTDLPENLNHIQCRIYCDESHVACDANSLALPLFLNDIKKDILKSIDDHQALDPSKSFTYLDDLKFNREIRIIFIKTIRKNILANYERYIVDVPESSSDIRQFDVVSYLSDQPEFMRSFLSKFLDTQLFVSFVDENAKRMQQSRLSIFDMDPDELSEHLSDKALEQAFQHAQRVHLMDLRQDQPDIEIKTIPASPMKLRRRMPTLSTIASRLTFSKSANRSTSIECNSGVRISPSTLTSSPPMHRNSVATVSLKGHLSLNQSLSPATRENNSQLAVAGIDNNSLNNSLTSLRPNLSLNPHPIANGKIVELIEEVRDITKRILVEKLSEQQAAMSVDDEQNLEEPVLSHATSQLVASLCDLIERVWAHGAFLPKTRIHQDNTGYCPLWNHLLAFTRIKLLETKSFKREFSDGSDIDLLSPVSQGKQYELMSIESSNLFGSTINWLNKKLNNSRGNKSSPLAKKLVDDLRLIHTLKDVKTDVGKARAFIRLSLEKKRLSHYLKELIDEESLLHSLYKPYAFLRCEEEREQFLTYLLTLQAVDLPCFTTTFISVIKERRQQE